MREWACLTGAVMWALSLSPALAGPACLTDSLSNYAALGSGGCDLGVFTVKDFGFSVLGMAEGVTPLDASLITVTPGLSAGGPTLRFESGGFSVTGTEWVTYLISYNVDPPPVIIRGFDEEMEAESPVFPGWAQVNTSLCVGGIYSPGCTSGSTTSLSVSHQGTVWSLTAHASFSPLVNMLGVQHTIQLDGGGSGSADFQALENRIETIPEPAAWLLGGCGLLMLLLLRRRAA